MEFNLTVPIADEAVAQPISPTDISQYIRLDQCERYLRLRMYERAVSSRFMEDYGVVPQSIPPLLSRSGARFEEKVEQATAKNFHAIKCSPSDRQGGKDADDNTRVIEAAQGLAPNAVLLVFQPRLQATVNGWRMRGDIDILRLERNAAGVLHVLIADMKSSTAAKVEHRLQVAFYYEMLAALLPQAGMSATIELGILYRGPDGEHTAASELEQEQWARQKADAERYFGGDVGLLERIQDIETYRGSVYDLVTGEASAARRVADTPFDDLSYHLTYKCDGCLYNEFCMKWSAERDDLSLLPHLTANDKNVLRRAGLRTTSQLANLKVFRPSEGNTPARHDLVAAAGHEGLAKQLAATWPVGPRLDELIHRARRYRQWKKDQIEAVSYIPSKGYGSLPYTDAEHNPNLVRVYIDAQHDYLEDRMYLVGSLIVGCENGAEVAHRRQSVVHLTDGPPDEERERALFVGWIKETLQAIVELAAPDQLGQSKAPIHLIFYNSFEQRMLLEALSRHFTTIAAATPLYDFLTQLAAFDSPIASYLDQEIREHKNYPMVCQSLQSVAAYLKFDWNTPEPYRAIFRTRLFDFWGKLENDETSSDGLSPWYTNRSRFNSQIPLEYAYAAWNDLALPSAGKHDEFETYRGATPELLLGFHARRLEAMERIASDFNGNKQTEKAPFDLPNLEEFSELAHNLAQALDEFVIIERHVELSGWKTARLAPPERRVLSGETLLVRYEEADQRPEVAAQSRDNERRRQLKEQYYAAYRVAHPDAQRVNLPKQQQAEVKWSQEGLRLKLRFEMTGVDCDLEEALALTTLRVGDRVVVMPRTTVDERLPVQDRVPFTPTPRQMLYGTRAEIVTIHVDRDATKRAVAGYVEIELKGSFGSNKSRGFLFGGIERPLLDGQVYTLDSDPNDIYGFWLSKVTDGLRSGGVNTLYDRVVDPSSALVTWPDAARAGQERFLAGLTALRDIGALHDFEPSKRDYIGSYGDAPTLLVQGPPGTGKSYSTAFALFARMQGAMAAGLPFRAIVSCKTHAATDVLLQNIYDVQRQLQALRTSHADTFGAYFDEQIVDIPLFRVRPKNSVPDGVIILHKEQEREDGEGRNRDALAAQQWCIAAATPGAVYGMMKETGNLFAPGLCDCLVLDEASQMNLPEAIMAALPLKADGQLVVVGDHRQMPPIIKHAWGDEPRRSFKLFRAYESLFITLLDQDLPLIQFSESFRLHAAMAEFLRREIYHLDNIPYFSRKQALLPVIEHADQFVQSVLAAEHPLVVVVHDEANSQLRNPFEQELITPVLEALADDDLYGLDAQTGLGVVVPHRAQRAALQEIESLRVLDPVTNLVTRSAVDTVERFQGGERKAIIISATESDRDYLLTAGEFLLDPRRLTVALSRAKQKLVLVASRSVFSLFSSDEETFANAQLWKNLLRRTCTVKLWEGERAGHRVEVWGNDRMHEQEVASMS